MQISQNVDWLVCMHVCFHTVCVFQTERPLVYPSTRLLAPLFIICLLSFVLSFLSVACLSSPPGFPNVKWQQRERQRGWRTFLMEGFYILTSIPSLFLHLAQWGRKMRRQTEEKNINKLHINWSAAGLAQTVTQPRPLTHCPKLKASHWLTDKPNHAAGNNMEVPVKRLDFTFSNYNLLVLSALTHNWKLQKKIVSRSVIWQM